MHVLRERCYRALNRVIPCDITQVLTLPLAQTAQPNTDVSDYQFAYLNASEVLAYSREPSNELKPEMAALIENKKARCFAITQHGNLAAYIWVATGTIDPKLNCGGGHFLGIGLALTETVAYFFKALVLPSHRGKKLNGWILYTLNKRLQAEGFEWVITTTDWTNYAFQSSATKAGFRQVALAGEFIIGSRRFYKLPDTGIPGVKLRAGS